MHPQQAPLDLQAMAEICQNGYADALRFLQENSKDVFSSTSTHSDSLVVSNPVLLLAGIM